MTTRPSPDNDSELDPVETEVEDVAGEAADASDDPPDRTIGGRYAVVRTLGQGASGRTFLCDDLQEQRRVAVKELRFEHLDSWKHLELFEREARVLSLLDHPSERCHRVC